MENTDDDIYILSSHDTLDGSVGDGNSRLLAQEFVISRSPGSRPDPAVQALQQAYAELKKRYNESTQRNQQMSRALRDVGRLKSSDSDMATYSDHTESFNSQGAAATGEQGCADSDNLRAQQGYIRYLEREKVSNEARIQQISALKTSYEDNCKAMQIKLKETVSDLHRKDEDLKRAHETIKELKEENMQLKDDRDAFRKHASDMQDHMQNALSQSSVERQNRELEELKVKYHHLEEQCKQLKEECDRLKVSEGIAQADLQASNKKFLDLQQSYMAVNTKCHHLEEELQMTRDIDLPSGSSIPTAQELVHLKRVISDLKRTVEQQRDFLRRIGQSQAIGKIDPSFGVQKRLANDEAILGPSWENVPSNPVAVKDGILYVKDGGGKNSPSETPANTSSNVWNTSPRRSNSTNSGAIGRASVTQEQSRSEILRRRPSENVPSSPRSKSEVLVRTNDMQGCNVREVSPLGDFTWQQQTLNNISHMNGGTAQYQSAYDNTRHRTPQAVIGDNFLPVLDNTPAFPVPPELQHSPEEYRNASVNLAPVNGRESSEEKVCPVCSRDFAAMLMEDFQTHVFECFDDQSAPETLRPVAQTERICPMCNALFPEAVPQDEFEKHVQNHFEQEIIDRFEVINP